MAREIVVPTQTVTEDIVSINEYPSVLVRVDVAYSTAAGPVPNSSQSYDIDGDDFAELMSANPEWAPGKPAGTYRNEDLWIFIDRKRASNA